MGSLDFGCIVIGFVTTLRMGWRFGTGKSGRDGEISTADIIPLADGEVGEIVTHSFICCFLAFIYLVQFFWRSVLFQKEA